MGGGGGGVNIVELWERVWSQVCEIEQLCKAVTRLYLAKEIPGVHSGREASHNCGKTGDSH